MTCAWQVCLTVDMSSRALRKLQQKNDVVIPSIKDDDNTDDEDDSESKQTSVVNPFSLVKSFVDSFWSQDNSDYR